MEPERLKLIIPVKRMRNLCLLLAILATSCQNAAVKKKANSDSPTTYYPDGKIKKEDTILPNDTVRTLLTYFENGNPEVFGQRQGEILQGRAIQYREDGSILGFANFQNGNPLFDHYKFYENGNLKTYQFHWPNGTFHITREYDTTGKLISHNGDVPPFPALFQKGDTFNRDTFSQGEMLHAKIIFSSLPELIQSGHLYLIQNEDTLIKRQYIPFQGTDDIYYRLYKKGLTKVVFQNVCHDDKRDKTFGRYDEYHIYIK